MVTDQSYSDRGGLAISVGCLLLVFLCGSLLCPRAAAQARNKYDELPVNAGLKKNTSSVGHMLSEGRFDAAGGQQLFDDYYQDFLLPQWTPTKDIANLPKLRHDLGNQLRKKNAGAPATVHDHFNALLLEFMQKLAAGNYHPAVRANAMLMIGELNRVEQPPTPLPEALEVMVAAVQSSKLSDGVRAVAMVGIKRHVIAGVADEDARKKLTAVLLHLAADEMPAGTARDGREWILRQAIDILGRLGSVGENNAVFRLLANTVSNAKLPLKTRTAAAESLGRLDYSGASGINAADVAAVLGQLAIDACAEELQQVKNSDPISRPRLMERLSAVLLALVGGEDASRKGIISLAGEPNQQAFLGELQKTIESMTDWLSDKKHDDDKPEGSVQELQTKLEAWLKKKA
jgi:hypothetical protein